jgi:hypothetical protein
LPVATLITGLPLSSSMRIPDNSSVPGTSSLFCPLGRYHAYL